jgi:hypothetical protein
MVYTAIACVNNKIAPYESGAGEVRVTFVRAGAHELTNRTTAPHSFDVAVVGPARQFTGYRYDALQSNVVVGSAPRSADLKRANRMLLAECGPRARQLGQSSRAVVQA